MSAPAGQLRQPSGHLSVAARLVWIALPDTQIDAASAALLRRGVGGVVLFSRNITGAEQLRRLTGELRQTAAGPLRIAIDHEGGHIVRLGAPLTRFPSAMAVSATGSTELAYAVARAAGRELAALGIDVNLAPVLDVCHDPLSASVGVRSFGSSVELVGRFGAATVRGYRDAGIAATAKHFPGHGRTPIDPHHALPEISGGIEVLRQADLPPFSAAIEAGVDIVMASHTAYAKLTGGLPSTLAEPVVGGLLRGELGFGGLALSDAMNMGALANAHAIPAACVKALAAGLDAVMPLLDHEEVLAAIEDALISGELPSARADEAVQRSRQLDERLSATADEPPVALPNLDHIELARLVARRSLTLTKGAELLPLSAATSVAVIEFASRRPSPVEERQPAATGQPAAASQPAAPSQPAAASLGAALEAHLPRTRSVLVDGLGDLSAGRQAASEAAAAAEFVIVATRDAYLWPEEQELVASIAAGDRPTMLVAMRNPYDLAQLPQTSAAAAAYADVPATLEALADALTGRAGWPGTLPLDLPTPLALPTESPQ